MVCPITQGDHNHFCTVWPGPKPSSTPSDILIHAAISPQHIWAENWGLCPFGVGGAGSPSNTMWPGPRPTCMPSFIMICQTVWPQCTNVSDRTDRQTDRQRQRSDSIGRTVLQTVAQKNQGGSVFDPPCRSTACKQPRGLFGFEQFSLKMKLEISSNKIRQHLGLHNMEDNRRILLKFYISKILRLSSMHFTKRLRRRDRQRLILFCYPTA